MSRRATRLRPRQHLAFARALVTSFLLGGGAEGAEPPLLVDAATEPLLRVLRTAGSDDAPAPKDAGGSAPTGAERAPPAGRPRPVVYGIILGRNGWVAYIEDPGSGLVGAYRVGDELAGATVEAIEEDSVVLKTADGPLQLRLDDRKPGSWPRQR